MPSPNNINKSIPAIPVDGNKRQASAVMLPIVNESGTIVNYLPIKCTDNGDGTATLDVGLALNGNIDIGDVNLLNLANAKINPATEDTLQDIKAVLDALNLKDYSTEATLSAIKAVLDNVKLDTAKLDVNLSTRATETTASGIKTNTDKLDVNLSTVATEATISALKLLFDTALARLSAGGVVSTVNSSSTPLGISGVFTGTAEDVLGFSHITIQVFSDVASATDGLSVQWSANGTNWDDVDVYTIPANNGKSFTFGPQAQFFRIVYTNGVVAQTSFRLHVIKKTFSQKPSSHRINDEISSHDDAELVKAVLTGLTESGIFKNAKVSDEGFLKVVLPPPTAPSGSTSVQTLADSSMSGTVDTLYIIPNGATLKIQQLRAGSQRTTSGGTKVELYYDPAGTGIGMSLIDKLYTDGSSANSSLDADFVGNGTRAIRLRRVNFGGGSVEIFATWRGYI